MSYFMVDIEADGPIPGDYSMVALGAVLVKEGLETTFKASLRPISDKWLPVALEVSGYTREDSLNFPDPLTVMTDFESWIQTHSQGRPMLISDNNGFDAMFIGWYFHHFLGRNPFGHSSTNLGSLYKGLVKDAFQNFKHLRRTEHNHDPLQDALGNAEALLHMKQEMGLKIRL